MKHRFKTTAAALCLLCMGVCGVSAGCGGGGGDSVSTNPLVVDPLAPAVTRGRYRDLEYVLTLPRTQFSVTDDITWTLAVTNIGDEPVSIQASHPTFDNYYIYKGDERIQLGEPSGADKIGTEIFAPGQTRTYLQRWEEASYLIPKAPGKYTLTSWVVAPVYNDERIPGISEYEQPSPFSPAPITFTIK